MIRRLLFVTCICTSLLSFNAFSDVEVIDGNENYERQQEEQQAAFEQPVAHDDFDESSNDNNNEPAFAQGPQDPTNSTQNLNLLNKVQGLQQEIQELRGQLEVQSHDIKLLQDQLLSFYKDLDARVRGESAKLSNNTQATTPIVPPPTALKSSTPVPTPIQPVIDSGHTNPADEQISYLAAYELVKNKEFDKATAAMETFVTKYPRGGYTANAQYWLGELYMVKRDYTKAIEHFNIVLDTFPSSSKNAASLLKIGYALAASGKIPEARIKLQAVVKNYPDTQTAHLAMTKLDALKNQ